MNKTAALCGLAAFVLSLSPSFAASDDDHFDGVYEFVRMETPDGVQTTQKGMLIAKDGYICHVRVARERETLSREDSEAERTRKAAAAFAASNATCGAYTPGEGKISVNWAIAVNPGVEGNNTEFLVEHAGGEVKIAPAAAPQFKFVYKKK